MTTICSFTSVGSSFFARSSKRRVFLSLFLSVTNRDCTRCIRPGRTGTGRSSPSETSPAVAVTLNAAFLRPLGAVTRNVRFVPPPGFTVNGFCASASPTPNAAFRLVFRSGSRMSSASVPESGLSDALFTTTLIAALSPSRRKRGTYGRTMRSFTVRVSFSAEPPRRSFVTAWTKTFHDVTESGTVNEIVAEPSAPVRRCGCQNAVSEKLLRRAAGGASPAESSRVVSASFFFERESTASVSSFGRSFAFLPRLARPTSCRAAFIAIGAEAGIRSARRRRPRPRPAAPGRRCRSRPRTSGGRP